MPNRYLDHWEITHIDSIGQPGSGFGRTSLSARSPGAGIGDSQANSDGDRDRVN